MLFKQLFDQETWTYTYLIADPANREAVLIDPVNTHIDDYLALLKEHNLQLKYTLETHVHADHITASGLLRQRLGAQTGVSELCGAETADIQIKDGDVFSFGHGEQIKVIATPGHTKGSISFLWRDRLFLPVTLCLLAAVAVLIFKAAMPVRFTTALLNVCLPCPMKHWSIPDTIINSVGSAASCRSVRPIPVWQARPGKHLLRL